MTEAPILVLLDSEKSFVLECDPYHLSIKTILSQNGKLEEFPIENVYDSKRRCSVYDPGV